MSREKAIEAWKGSDDLRPLLRPIGELSLDPANIRRHGERNRETIRASLMRFGQQKPIVVDKQGIVRAGNGTLAEARELGWSHVAVTRSDLPTTELTGYAIADNRTAELAEWDDEALAATLKALESDGFDLDAAGFNSAELDSLLGALGTDGTPDSLQPAEEDPENYEPPTNGLTVISPEKIADVTLKNTTYPLVKWTIEQAKVAGFEHVRTDEFPMQRRFGAGQDDEIATEPVIVLRKPKS